MKPGILAATVTGLVLAAGFASAQTPAPKLGKPQQAIELRNRASQPIIYAAATVTGRSQPVVFTTNRPIQTSVGQQVFVPPGSCITSVTVRFKDGRTLKLDNQHDCKKPKIEVTNRRIALTSAAVGNPPPLYEKSGQVIPPGEVIPPVVPNR